MANFDCCYRSSTRSEKKRKAIGLTTVTVKNQEIANLAHQ